MAVSLKCLRCGKLLPVGHAGLCKECSEKAKGGIRQVAPHCSVCKAPLPFWPKSRMGWANPPCKCT